MALAGCGGGDGGNVTAPAGSVAAVTPPAGQDWSLVVSKTADDGYVMGNPNAALKLVEYGSRLCPGCGQFYAQSHEPLIENYVKTGKVSFEFRDFPVHGAVDLPSILLGHCVATEAFFPVLNQMFESQAAFLEKQSQLSPERYTQLQGDPVALSNWIAEQMGYIEFMQQRGIAEPQVRKCLNDRAAIEKIAANTQKASAAGVGGTPSFMLNGKLLEQTGSWAEVEAALKAAGA